jgi:gas vesicle protein
MKKLLVIVACVGALAFAGCSSNDTPENFGKNYIQKKFENMNCNLVDLDYAIKNETENSATVVIEGNIKYKEELKLVKEGDEWKLAGKEAAAAVHEEKKEEAAKAEEEAPAKEEKAEEAHH